MSRFRLATVLRVAQLRERQREAELAASLAEARYAAEVVGMCTSAYEMRPDEPRADTQAFLATRNVVDLRARAVALAAQQQREAEDRVSAARDQWTEAAQHRRMVDELRDRHGAAQAVLASRAAQRTLDDLARRSRRSGTERGRER